MLLSQRINKKSGRAQEPPRWGGGPRSELANGRWWGFPYGCSFTNTDNRYLFPLILQHHLANFFRHALTNFPHTSAPSTYNAIEKRKTLRI